MRTILLAMAAAWLAAAPWALAQEEDPFGSGDPFATLEQAKDEGHVSSGVASAGQGGPSSRAEVFLKGFLTEINKTSPVNPGNRALALMERTGTVETRLTAQDFLDRDHSWRWLFRGFAAGPNYHGADGSQGAKEARVDEIFTDWKGDTLFSSFGKRRINWGHAQGFNPVNVVAPPRDPLNPQYQTEGQPMIWASASAAMGTADVILTRDYGQDWNSAAFRWGARWTIASATSDFSLYYFGGEKHKDGGDYEAMTGVSFATSFTGGFTLYAEGAWFARNYRGYYGHDGERLQKAGGYAQGVAGVSVNLGSRSSFFVEALYNGQGYSKEERSRFMASPAAADFIPLAMNRGYLLANLRKDFMEKWNFGANLLAAGDGSASARVELDYSITDYYEAQVSYLRNFGPRDSEFGASPVKGFLQIGIKASF